METGTRVCWGNNVHVKIIASVMINNLLLVRNGHIAKNDSVRPEASYPNRTSASSPASSLSHSFLILMITSAQVREWPWISNWAIIEIKIWLFLPETKAITFIIARLVTTRPSDNLSPHIKSSHPLILSYTHPLTSRSTYQSQKNYYMWTLLTFTSILQYTYFIKPLTFLSL